MNTILIQNSLTKKQIKDWLVNQISDLKNEWKTLPTYEQFEAHMSNYYSNVSNVNLSFIEYAWVNRQNSGDYYVSRVEFIFFYIFKEVIRELNEIKEGGIK